MLLGNLNDTRIKTQLWGLKAREAISLETQELNLSFLA